ncbi:hypothetical protein Trydic_g21638 [Trypoxylus dichotomus]
MRFLIGSVAILASCSAIFAVSPDTRAFEQQISDALECVRDILVSGLPDQGLPSFNPLEIPSILICHGSIAIEDLYLAGVTNFKQSNIKGTVGLIPPRYTLQLTLTFPLTSLKTKYDFDVSYSPSNSHIYGAGEFGLEAVNAAADLDLTATILGGIAVNNFDLWISLQGLNSFSLTGLYNDEECSAKLVEAVPADPSGVVASYAQAIHDIASDVVVGAVGSGALEGDGLVSTIMDQCINLK